MALSANLRAALRTFSAASVLLAVAPDVLGAFVVPPALLPAVFFTAPRARISARTCASAPS